MRNSQKYFYLRDVARSDTMKLDSRFDHGSNLLAITDLIVFRRGTCEGYIIIDRILKRVICLIRTNALDLVQHPERKRQKETNRFEYVQSVLPMCLEDKA